MPDPERAPLVLAIFERYVTGRESDRTTAEWLNAKGATTARGRRFGADTVREMLLNASYCGYVTGLRDQSREIRGRHEPIVPEELFDRVQEIRRWRTRVVKGGRAAEDYLLSQLLYCERCGARMQGTRGSRAQHRRYQCGRRCSTTSLASGRSRRSPPSATSCSALFDRIWQDSGRIVAVTPHKPFARYFQAATEAECQKRERREVVPVITHRGIEVRLSGLP